MRRISYEAQNLSVLSVEPYGMKLVYFFSYECQDELSVLSVEPYGMKHHAANLTRRIIISFSALGRAVWDETQSSGIASGAPPAFQCSRSSRMG